jgi:hypothetical protein
VSKTKTIPKILKEIKNYQPMVVDYSFQKTISYSAFSTYSACPKKWSLMYKDGHYISEPSTHMTFGTAIHNTIQNYLTVMYNTSTAEADKIDLGEYFQEQFTNTYKETYTTNKKTHYSTPLEMREFYDDGLMILDFLKKKKGQYFSKKGWHLVGCEIPILISPFTRYRNVIFKGFVDLILYHEETNKFIIYDIKTSTRGWGDREKKDETKISQILLYKHYFSKQFNVPEENIEVEFFIVKRKLPENNEFFLKPIQQFSPASGKNKTTKAVQNIEKFIDECFDTTGIKEKEHSPNPSKYACTYCPFRDRKDLCKDGIPS